MKSEFSAIPELAHVRDPKEDISKKPVTTEELLFVTFLVFHLQAAFRANEERLFEAPSKLRQDIREFLSLPIPRQAWMELRDKQDENFAEFVASAAGIKPSKRKSLPEGGSSVSAKTAPSH